MSYILALDQGTTSSRAIIFNAAGETVAIAQKEISQIYPQPGWVEHDAREIWATQHAVALEALHGLKTLHGNAATVSGLAITNQRETFVIWDRATGQPIANAIVWQDHRTADYCEQLVLAGLEEDVRNKTGLLIDAYFSATKISWLLDSVPGARNQAEDGHLACGTIDSWLIWNLTGGRVHVTDVSNASRTSLFNIHTQKWDEELLSLFNIPRNILPAVCASSGIIAECDAAVLGVTIPIAANTITVKNRRYSCHIMTSPAVHKRSGSAASH